ncbi:MAG: 50S ribosomal protein L11 methyltransferase [Anaerolineales bacterium]
MNWLEISLRVDGELAEAVSEVFSRHIQQGVATELEIDEEKQRATTARVVVRGYIPLDGQENETKEHIERDLWHLRQIIDFPEPSYQLIQEVDWTEQWRQHYRPMPIGERLLIVPAWFEPVQTSRKALTLEPGMAFGTGTHPTTRLCIEELEKQIHDADRVFDVGCGSGILSIASVLLGAGEVIAMDVDSAALQVTAENARRNKVSDQIHVVSGSIQELISGDPRYSAPGDVVVANILTKVLIKLLDQGLSHLLLPGARLILSGILADQLEKIITAASRKELELCALRGEKDWRVVVFEKIRAAPA